MKGLDSIFNGLASGWHGGGEARPGTVASASAHTRVMGQLGGTTSLENLVLQVPAVFEAGTQRFKKLKETFIIGQHRMGIYAENVNICLATSLLIFCIYSLYRSSLFFFSTGNPLFCSTNA